MADLSNWEPVPSVYDPIKNGSIDGTDTEAHDRGIIRALKARYKPNKSVVGTGENTLFVGRLSPKTDEDTLSRVFSKCGEIRRLRLIRDIVTGFSKRYAFVEFEEKADAKYAFETLNKNSIDQHVILVDFECERNLPGWKPRRLGGGIGGRKEAGQLRFGGTDRPFIPPVELSHQRELDRGYDNDREADRNREYARGRDRERDRDRDYSSGRDRNRGYGRDRDQQRDRDREYGHNRDREKDNDRNRDREKDSDRDYSRERDRSRQRDRGYERESDRRDRKMNRDRDRQREMREPERERDMEEGY